MLSIVARRQIIGRHQTIRDVARKADRAQTAKPIRIYEQLANAVELDRKKFDRASTWLSKVSEIAWQA